MKIIDFEKKGNMVKFYVGSDDCAGYYGDDWDDAPYEHNAGRVYSQFIQGWFVKKFEFDDIVAEPCEGYSNSSYSKDDMKNRVVPCICVLKKKHQDSNTFYDDFNDIQGNKNVLKFYLGDKVPASQKIIFVKDLNKIESKWIHFKCDIDEKYLEIAVKNISTFFKFSANDYYGEDVDPGFFEKLISMDEDKLKEYVLKQLILIYETYNHSDIDLNHIKDTFEFDIINGDEVPNNRIRGNDYYICYANSDNFKIGKITY